MNLSMQDAENLAWKLAMVWHGQADRRILATFAQERIPTADSVIALTRSIIGSRMVLTLVGYFIRFVMALTRRLPGRIARKILERVAQLRVRYSPESSLLVAKEGSAWLATKRRSLLGSIAFWFCEDLCQPGSRAIDGELLDLTTTERSRVRLRQWQAEHVGAYGIVVFVDAERASVGANNAPTDRLLDSHSDPAGACVLRNDVLKQIQSLAEALSLYRPSVSTVIVLYDLLIGTPTPEVASGVAVQLHKVHSNVRVFADVNQGPRFDNKPLSGIYQCHDGRAHVAYLIRPDAYVAARAPLGTATDEFQQYMHMLADTD